MNHELYFEYNPWWEGDYDFGEILPREIIETQLDKLMPEKAMILLTGLRRVGKTTLMKQLIKKLLENHIKPEHIFYVSIDDYQLKDLTITEVIDEYRKIHKIRKSQKIYLFLDEITYQVDFRQQLKNIYDKANCKLVVSSSSSSALRDKRGWLTGRGRHIEITLLTFEEYLIFKKITVKKRDSKLLESYFEEYMQQGGMPEYILTQNREYLTSLLDDILYKNIIAHHGIKQPQLIKDYFFLLMERAGKQISLNKIAKILKISPDTAKRYLSMFEDTYLIYLVPRFAKTNETILSTKKIYAADLGIRHIFTGFRDKGAIFENIVFSMIKHKKPRYVYQNGIELDFMTEDNILIEVKYGQDLNEKQQALFDTIKAKQKIVINGFNDLNKLKEL